MENDSSAAFVDELWGIIAEELAHLRDRNRIEFWTTHAEDDVEHGRRSLEIVLAHADTPALQAGVLDCARKSVERLMMFQRGIGRAYRGPLTRDRSVA